jgi:uncharacterized protein YndB with AHSA1/START domain
MAATPASSLQVTLHRVYRKGRAEVFKAWTDPKELKRWWGPPGYDAPSIEVDLRVGGRYRFTMRKQSDGGANIVTGVYREVVAGERLVFTWNWEEGPPFGSNTLVTVEFRDVTGGTEIVIVHERFESEHARDEHTKGWNGCLDRFDGWLSNLKEDT